MQDNLISLNGISIERLRSFCEIVDAGSPVQAAAKYGVEPAQYSRQIRELERALEVKLFVREGKYLRLTRDGVRLSALTKAYFGALSELRDGFDGGGKPICLGAAESITRWMLMPHYAEIVRGSNCILEFTTHGTDGITTGLESGLLDVGILRSNAISAELEALPFPDQQYVFIVPRRYLPEKSATSIKTSNVLPLILLSGDGHFSMAAKQLFPANELQVKVVARVENFSMAAELSKTIEAATFAPFQAYKEFSQETFASIQLRGLESLNRKLVVAFNRKTAEVNGRVQRVAAKISRFFETKVE